MESPGAKDQVRFSREAKIIILLIGLVLAIWLLVRVQRVLGPFVWAAITAYVLSPIVDWLEARLGLRRIWITVLIYLLGLAAVAWALTALVPLVIAQLEDLAAEAPRIFTGLAESLASLNEYLATEQIHLYGISIDPKVLVSEAVRNLQNLVGYVTSHAIPAFFNVLEGVGQVILYLIATFYLLRGWPGIRRIVPRLMPRAYRREALGLLRAIDRVMGAYIRGQLLLICVMSAATFVTLSLLRVRFALTIGLVSGVLEVIPLFGPFMAGGIAVTIALFQPSAPFGWSNLTLALAVVLAYTVLRQIEDQLVVPNLVGPMVNLHPLLVLFALFAGGHLAGLTGMVLAVPVAAAAKIVVIYLYGKIWDEEPAGSTARAAPPAVATESHTTSGEQP